MNVTIIKKIATPEEIIQAHPLSSAGQEQIINDREEIKQILNGQNNRFLVIAGPCSAWPSEAVLEYARRLKKLNDEIKDGVKLVMRVYIQKPRTTKGWTGPVNQPDPYRPADISEGINYARGLMIKIIEMGLPVADEALFTHNAKGFIELLSWVAIGARSVEDQEHRVFASAVGCPVGMKNSTSGSIEIGVNGIVAAQHSHIAVFQGFQVETRGNPYAHLVLRGGSGGPNYSVDHLLSAKELMKKKAIRNSAIIIDASHDNCKIDGKKDYRLQSQVVCKTIENLKKHPELKNLVKGFMLESFIKGGNQNHESLTSETVDRGGLSITDPCLGWEETEQILKELKNYAIKKN